MSRRRSKRGLSSAREQVNHSTDPRGRRARAVSEALETRILLAGATPVFRYQFNEGSGTTVSDSGAPGGNGGTLVGQRLPQWVPGPSGQAGDFALDFNSVRNPNNTTRPYYRHILPGMPDPAGTTAGRNGPFDEGLVQLNGPVSDLLTGTASLAAWVKTTSVGDNQTWAAPAIVGTEQNGGTADIRWGYIDATGHMGISVANSSGVLTAGPINDGSWHLVVMTRDSTTGAMQVWVDGAQAGSGTRETGLMNNAPFSALGATSDTIGTPGAPEGYNFFGGALDDIRIFDHVLSASEIQALLPPATSAPAAPTNLTASVSSGLARLQWTDNASNELSFQVERATSADGPFTNVGTVGAVSGSGLQGTFTDAGSRYSNTTFYYRVRAFNSFNGGSNSAYSNVVSITLPAVPASDRYQFDEGSGTTVADTGTPAGDNNGTLAGAAPPTFVPGPTGNPSDKALNFTGAGTANQQLTDAGSSVVQTANNLATTLSGNASVSAWVKTTAIGNNNSLDAPAITGTSLGSAPIGIRWGYLNASGRMGVAAGLAGAGVVTTSPINDGQWHLITLTRDAANGEIKIYVDGVLDAQGVGEAGGKTIPFNLIGAVTRTGVDQVPNGYNFFNGQLDDVRFFNAVLSPADVVGLLPQVTAAPAAPTNLTATVSGGAVTLQWRDNADNEFNYSILRGDSPSGPFSVIARIPPIPGSGTTATFTDVSGGHVGQTAYYQVAAFNSFNGGTTSTAGPVSATFSTAGAGVEGHYYNQAFWGGEPVVSVLAGTVNQHWNTTPDPAITNGGRASTIFTGKIKTAEAGVYTFVSNTDDDGYLFVNGVLVSSDPGGHGERNATNLLPLNLTTNTQYNFVLMQTNSGGGAAGAHLLWVTPAMSAAGNTVPVAIPFTNLLSQSDTPPTPTDFAVDSSGPGTHSVGFTFNSTNIGVVHYQLQRSGDGGLSWRTVSQIEPGTASMDSTGTVFPTLFQIQDASAAPGQSYRYRVVAMNFDHTSAPTAAIPVTTPPADPQESGVQVRYYNGELVSDQDPRNFAVSSPGPAEFFLNQFGNIDIDYDTGSPDITAFPLLARVHTDSFTTVWTGKIRTNAAGVYTFVTNSDDDAIMYVNGVAVSQDLGAHTARDATQLTPLTLAANTDYNFVLIQNDRNATSSIRAQWIEPGQTTPVAIPPGVPGGSGGLLQTMSAPYQQSVSATGVLTENPAGSAAGSLTSAAPASGSGVTLNWTDQSLSELWFEIQRTVPDAANPNNPDNTKWTDVGRAGMNQGTFTDTSATPGSTYFYRVRGANFDAVGPFSNVVKAVASTAVSDTVTGTAGDDTIALKRDADGVHVDWTMGAASGQVLINSANGLTINGNGGNDTIILDGSNGNPLPNLLMLNGGFTVNGGTLAIGPGQRVVVGHSATPNAATLDVQGLTVDSTGKLDLKNNTLKVHYSGASPASAIAGYLATGYAGGQWNGNGILSTDGSSSFALGLGDSAGVVTVKYTRNGDANLDGSVNFTDLVALAQNYNTASGATWAKGDFTYDGAVNFNDLVALAQNYGTTLAAGAVQTSGVSAAVLLASIAPAKPAPKPVARPIFAVKPLPASARLASAVGDVLQKQAKSAKVFQ
jgi:Concanavalin A-like lectin/glucanases superfamily/PA14 domain